MWFSFLLGTMYASYFDSYEKPVARQSRRSSSCNCGQPSGESDPISDRKDDRQSADLSDKKDERPSIHPPVKDDSGQFKLPRHNINPVDVHVTLLPNNSHDFDPQKNITLTYEKYHLTWTRVEPTLTNIFSAYYDERPAMNGPSIVLPGYQWKKFRNESLHCLFRYKDGSTECSPRKSILKEMDACNEQKEFDKKRERQFLHVFHICTLEPIKRVEMPTHIALSSDRTCQQASSLIPIYKHRPNKKIDFGLCVQTPVFDKTAQEIVSFIELYRMLGVQFFTMYILDVDHSTLSFLRKTYGGKNGILEMIHWTKNLHEKEPIHYYGEILAIHDCLYRNMHRVKYLTFVDLDEAIIPRRYPNWRSMLQEIDHFYIDSFIFANSVFMKTAPERINQNAINTWSSSLCDGVALPMYFTSFDRVKCVFHFFSRSKLIVKPELVVDTDIHGVCTRVSNTTHYLVPEDSAISQHYRLIPTIECRKNRKTRRYPVKYDDWMARYARPLLLAMRNKLC